MRKKLKNMVKSAKRNQLKRDFSNANGDSKKIWNLINRVLKKPANDSKKINCLKKDNKEITRPRDRQANK